MAIRKHSIKYTETDLFSFDSSANSLSIPETTLTTTQGTIFNHRYPSYSCKCRRGYSIFSDHLNVWKLHEEPEDYSRKDIARAYRLGMWY